jgi:hypothetical protein
MKRTLAITAAAMAALAPVAEATHKPGHGTPGNLTIAATPTTVKFGGTVTLSGKLTGANNAGRTVTVRQDPFPVDNFAEAGSATTNATGDWSLTQTPAVNTRYQARSGNDESAPVDVSVRPAITLRASDRTPRVGQRVRFRGRLCPEHDGVVVALQRRTPNGWSTLRSMTLKDIAGSTCSSFARRLRIRKDGAFRVRFPGDADHVAGNSRVRRLNAHAG